MNTSSILDLIITDAPGYVLDSGVLPPLADLDHCAVFCSLKVQYNSEPLVIRQVWNYNAANFDDFRVALDRAS